MTEGFTATPLRRFRCTRCGYGATCRHEPEQCPMCHRAEWFEQVWSPFRTQESNLDPATAPIARETDEVGFSTGLRIR